MTTTDWREIWREGFVPQLSIAALRALESALEGDDKRLLQGQTTWPPFYYYPDRPVEGACVIGYCGWQGEHLATVAEVNEFFDLICTKVDRALEGGVISSAFLDWFDQTPRKQVRCELLAEVKLALAKRI